MPPMQSLQRIPQHDIFTPSTPRLYNTEHPLHIHKESTLISPMSESRVSSWSAPVFSDLAKTGRALVHPLTSPPTVDNESKMNAITNISLYREPSTLDLSQSGPTNWIKANTETSVVYFDFRTAVSPPSSDSIMHCNNVNNTHNNSDLDTSNNSSANQTSSNTPEFPSAFVTSKLPSLIQFDDAIHESYLYNTQESLTSHMSPQSGCSPPSKQCSNDIKVGREQCDVSNTEGHKPRKRRCESGIGMAENKKLRTSEDVNQQNDDSCDSSANKNIISDNVDFFVDNEADDCDGLVSAKSKSRAGKKSTDSPNRCSSSCYTKSTLDNKISNNNNNNINNSPRTPFLPPCKICGAKASGFHYGVNSCEACKGFFRRVLKSPVAFFCTKNNSCNLKRNKRSSCRFCRYKRCLSLGMSKEAIKTGRYSHQKRTQDIIAVKYLQSYKDPDYDYFEFDEILENLLVSHHSNIVSSARFQDSYLYKKQKDYHKMFLVQRKTVSTTVTKNTENINIRRENSWATKIRPVNQKLEKSSVEIASDSISDLKKNLHYKRSKLESILLNIPCDDISTCNSSQSGQEKSVSPTYSSSSDDSGFSDYYGHSDESSSRYSTQSRTCPTNFVNEFTHSTTLPRLASSKSSTLPSANSQHSNSIKSHSVDFLDDSDSKILEEILKEFNQPFSSSNDYKVIDDLGDSGLDNGMDNERRQPEPEHEHIADLNSKKTESIRENAESLVKVTSDNNKNIPQQNARRLPNTERILKSDVLNNFSRNASSVPDDASSSRQRVKFPGTDTAQQVKDNDHLNRAAKCVTGYINFAKSIPGFESLPQQDQATMLRHAWDEIWILGAYRGFNCELGVAVMPSGVCFHMEEMEQSWGQDYARLAFDLADILKKSGVTEEMLVLLKAICIISPDRCELTDRENTEKTHWLLVRCLINHLDTAMPKPEMTFPGLVTILTSLRNLSELAQAHLSQGILDLHAESIGRNIISEPVTPF